MFVEARHCGTNIDLDVRHRDSHLFARAADHGSVCELFTT